MSVLRSLTIEKQTTAPPGGIYDITVPIPNGNMILSAARVDILLPTPTDYASIPKSVSLQIGTIIGNDFVVDNDPSANFFKVILELSIVQIDTDYYLSSNTNPNTGFRMNGDLNQKLAFVIRDNNGTIIDPDFFAFHFSILSDK